MLQIAPRQTRFQLDLAGPDDRVAIHRMRHDVYARELGQHPINAAGELRDPLDAFNIYLVARLKNEVVGFVSITPPGHVCYSIDKYLSRDELPFPCDAGLYEVRLLTVARSHRGSPLAGLLMLAALRYVEHQNGQRIVAIGRREVLSIYLKAGLQPLGKTITSGNVTFELLTAILADLRRTQEDANNDRIQRLQKLIDWRLPFPLQPPARCFHGGAFFDAIGPRFDSLDRRHDIINADVLDAWFEPSPKVIEALTGSLPWLMRTSPPAACEGLVQTVADVRSIPADCILPGSGSSDLIFRALRHWLTPASRVTLLDPTYGEYEHVLRKVIGCRVDRLTLSRDNGYQLTPSAFQSASDRQPELIVLVNPNSPTGRHMSRADLTRWLATVPPTTRVWIDETYIDYVDAAESLESFAAASSNVVVCKSMSKIYALSGMRAAYLAGPAALLADLRAITPPWVIGLPAQVAAVAALRDPDYYRQRYNQTHALRNSLAQSLTELGLDVIPGVANFLLAHMPDRVPDEMPNNSADAETLIARCRASGVFLRNAGPMGSALGPRALRIAVKSQPENDRIIRTLAAALQGSCDSIASLK